MPDAPDIVLCSKLCRHNPTDPKNKNKKESKRQKDPHPNKKSFPGHFKKGRLVRTPCFTEKVSGDKVYSNSPTFQLNKNFNK